MQVTPFLMFTGDAEAAIGFYRTLFADLEILDLRRWGPGASGKQGTIERASFTIAGQALRCFDSAPVHEFGFTPALSLFVDCEDMAQIDALWDGLSDGGKPLMPIGDYGFSRRFGWIEDRFGLSWQLNLP